MLAVTEAGGNLSNLVYAILLLVQHASVQESSAYREMTIWQIPEEEVARTYRHKAWQASEE